MFKSEQEVNNQRKKFDMIYDAASSKDFHFNPTILMVNKTSEESYSTLLKLVDKVLSEEKTGGKSHKTLNKEDKNFIARQLYMNLLKKNMGMGYDD